MITKAKQDNHTERFLKSPAKSTTPTRFVSIAQHFALYVRSGTDAGGFKQKRVMSIYNVRVVNCLASFTKRSFL